VCSNAARSIDSAFSYKPTEALIDARKEVGLEGNRDRSVLIPYFLLLPLEHKAPVKRFVSLQFLILINSRLGSLEVGSARCKSRYLHRTTQTQNKRRQTSMPHVEFEPTTPVFERAKTVHALNCTATEIG
jgi:hypothetical protein